jgi:hypothetical protein
MVLPPLRSLRFLQYTPIVQTDAFAKDSVVDPGLWCVAVFGDARFCVAAVCTCLTVREVNAM